MVKRGNLSKLTSPRNLGKNRLGGGKNENIDGPYSQFTQPARSKGPLGFFIGSFAATLLAVFFYFMINNNRPSPQSNELPNIGQTVQTAETKHTGYDTQTQNSNNNNYNGQSEARIETREDEAVQIEEQKQPKLYYKDEWMSDGWGCRIKVPRYRPLRLVMYKKPNGESYGFS